MFMCKVNNPRVFPYLAQERHDSSASFQIYSKLYLEKTNLDTTDRNCFILTNTDEIVKIQYFSKSVTGISIHGLVQNKQFQTNLYDRPLKSEKLSIYKCKENMSSTVISLNQYKCKLFQIRLGGNEAAFFPLFHSEQ